MKVLILPSWYTTEDDPNAGIFIKEQVEALYKLGVGVSVLYADLSYRNHPGSARVTTKSENGIWTYRLRNFFPPKVTEGLVHRWARKYTKLYTAYTDHFGSPDLIHAHSFLAGIAAMHLSRTFGRPYLITEHSQMILTDRIPNRYRGLICQSYDQADRLIAVSRALQSSMIQLSRTTPLVLPNLVDEEKFALADDRKRGDGPTVFIAIGDLDRNKNFVMLIQAFARFRQKGYDAVLRVIGKGPLRGRLARLIRENQLSDSTHLLGHLSQEGIIHELGNADVLVSCSQVETFGMTLIEATSMGLPVIATDSGGPADIVNSVNGLLIPKNSSQDLLETLIDMHKRLSEYNRCAIRQQTIEKYSASAIAKRLLSIYKEILQIGNV